MPFHAPTATGLMLRLWCTQGFTPCTSQIDDWSWVRLGTWDSYLKHTTSPLAVTSPSLGSLGLRKIPRKTLRKQSFRETLCIFSLVFAARAAMKTYIRVIRVIQYDVFFTKTPRIWQVTCLSWNNLKYTWNILVHDVKQPSHDQTTVSTITVASTILELMANS